MSANPLISVIVPCYKCSKSLLELYKRLALSLEMISSNFEIILVNDASPENDWEIIKKIGKQDSRIKGINFSRNFGQHNAITAGLELSRGEWVVVMDGDLQDMPEEIINLYKKAQEGHNIVFARRAERKDSFIKKLGSSTFYKILHLLSGMKIDPGIANFSISSRLVIESIKEMKEQTRYFPQFMHWVGFNSAILDVKHSRREKGESSYNFSSLLRLAFGNIIAYSDKPLILSVKLGLSISVLSVFYIVYLLFRYFFHDISVEGWVSVMVSIWFFSGLMLANMGIIGIYIAKVFAETKNRPLYIIKESINV